MIKELDIEIPSSLITKALNELPNIDFRLTLNEPTGNFFYEPWIIKKEFENTVWHELLNTLSYSHGEARLVSLASKECYASHADVDNRWHLALTNENSFLINLENLSMYSCEIGCWYTMNAGIKHTATNFGSSNRIHLLVRQLLTNSELIDPVEYVIEANTTHLVPHRFIFDEIYSPVINKLNINGQLRDFDRTESSVCFKTERIINIPKHKNFIVHTK